MNQPNTQLSWNHMTDHKTSWGRSGRIYTFTFYPLQPQLETIVLWPVKLTHKIIGSSRGWSRWIYILYIVFYLLRPQLGSIVTVYDQWSKFGKGSDMYMVFVFLLVLDMFKAWHCMGIIMGNMSFLLHVFVKDIFCNESIKLDRAHWHVF